MYILSSVYIIDIDDIERQNLMRDAKIDQMLFFKDWLPYSACILVMSIKFKIRKNSTHFMAHEHIRAYSVWAAKPAQADKKLLGIYAHHRVGVLTLKANDAYIETYILSINWGCFAFSLLHFIFFAFGGSMEFFFCHFIYSMRDCVALSREFGLLLG